MPTSFSAVQVIARLGCPGARRKGWVVLGLTAAGWEDISWHRTYRRAMRVAYEIVQAHR